MSKIVCIEAGRFDYDFVGEFKFFKPGPDGVVRRPSILVRITDDDGVQGWGQAVPVPTWSDETPETVQSTLSNYLADALLGEDPTDLEQIHRRMNNVIRPNFTVGQPICKAALDLACYDLLGKREGKSVAQLLGGAEVRDLTLSWTVASPAMEVVAEQLEEGWRRGYRNFNIKVGYPQTPEYDLGLAKRVRQFAPDGFLWADANTGYDLETALEIIPRLADAGVDVLESPLPPTQIRGYQALKRQGSLPILMDEGLISPVETEEFIALGMMDGVALKPARSAGLWPSAQIIRLAKEHTCLLLGSGLTDPDVSLAGSLNLYAWAGIVHPCALNGPQFLANSLAQSGLNIAGGKISLPSGPGLGLELDEARVNTCLSVLAQK